jgi:hypothetical protein
MAVVAARVDDLERGDLPAICAKTGEPCVGLVKDTLWAVPRWVSALAAFAVVPYYVARMWVGRRLEVTLPIAPSRLAWIRRFVRAAWIALVAAAAGLAAALFGAGMIGVAALIVGVAVYVSIVYAGDHLWVGARPSHRPEVVILTRVHPDFARAVNNMYDERAADDSPLVVPADC